MSRSRFDEIFQRVAKSGTLRRIWRDIYRGDYPDEAVPFSFVTVRELQSLGGALKVGRNQRIADIACGQGGPGIVVAKVTGAAVVGIDSSMVAIHGAVNTACRLRFQSRATFVVADAAALGLGSGSVDGVMCIDALQLLAHRNEALAEVGRILRSEGRFVFTTWLRRAEGKGPPFPIDYRPLLEASSLRMEQCDEPDDWEPRETAVFELIEANSLALTSELGESVAGMLVTEAKKMLEVYPLIRRVNIVAQRV